MQKNYIITAGTLFFIIAVVHASRISLEWQIVVDGTTIPMWVSYVASLIAALMAFFAVTIKK